MFFACIYMFLYNIVLMLQVSELIAFDITKSFDSLGRLELHSNLLHASLQSPIKAIRNAVQKRLLPEFSKNSLLLEWVIGELLTFQPGLLVLEYFLLFSNFFIIDLTYS